MALCLAVPLANYSMILVTPDVLLLFLLTMYCGFVLPEDVKTLAPDVLRHRLVTTYEAEAQSVTGEQIITRLLEGIGIP